MSEPTAPDEGEQPTPDDAPSAPEQPQRDVLAGQEEPPSIHVLMARILDELPAIGKEQVNQQQNFKFRGIDDVLNALTPLLGKYGVFFVPEVLERVVSERVTRSNNALYEVSLHVRYTFYGPRGDSIAATGWGEGTDSGDKSTAKAMTGAMKYVLFQVFAIATQEVAAHDIDHGTPEETTGRREPGAPRQQQEGETPAPATEAELVDILNRIKQVVEEDDDYPKAWKDSVARPGSPGTYRIESLEQMVTGDRDKASALAAEKMRSILDEYDQAKLKDAPCVVCGSTRSDRATIKGEWRCQNATACEKRKAKREEGGDPDAGPQGDEAPSGLVCGGETGLGCGEVIPDEPGPVYDDRQVPWHPECCPDLGGAPPEKPEEGEEPAAEPGASDEASPDA